jgi:5-methylcytosine-specific restriction endonuclease McrA
VASRTRPAIRSCDWCGDTYESAFSHQKFCGRNCSQKAFRKRNEAESKGNTHEKRCRKHGTKYELINPATVFQRDKWVCQLCKAAIDPAVEWPSPGCGTIDHIVPISVGGDHVLSNVQAAHAICNMAKRNRLELFNGTQGATSEVSRTSSA